MKIFQILLLTFFTICCTRCNEKNASNEKYSEKEKNDFLDTITKNIVVRIDDFTEIKKEPTTDLLLYTRYPLSEKMISEYNKVGVLKNSADDISDLVSYELINYKLVNEKGQKLKFVEDGAMNYLQENSLGDFDGILNQRLIIRLTVNSVYSTLKGYITIEFKMPDNLKRKVKIPVNISIDDIPSK
jgi:hypothetical protein